MLCPHELFVTLWTEHASLPCLSLSPGVCSNSCPLRQCCRSTISSVTPSPLALTLPQQWVFCSELGSLHQVAKVLELQLQISPSNEYSGLISFRIAWFDLLSIQGTFKSLLQHHNLKASILWCSAFFMVQLSHPYMTTGETIALIIWTFVGKVIAAF